MWGGGVAANGDKLFPLYLHLLLLKSAAGSCACVLEGDLATAAHGACIGPSRPGSAVETPDDVPLFLSLGGRPSTVPRSIRSHGNANSFLYLASVTKAINYFSVCVCACVNERNCAARLPNNSLEMQRASAVSRTSHEQPRESDR